MAMSNPLKLFWLGLIGAIIVRGIPIPEADISKDTKSSRTTSNLIIDAAKELLDVIYESKVKVIKGEELSANQVRLPPSVTWKHAPKTYYTLIMIDPDMFDRENHLFSELLHWLVVNIGGGDVTKGETIVDYLAPNPPKGTSYHRFVFLLFKQKAKQLFNETFVCNTSVEGREYFNTTNFAHDYKLGTPVASNFYQTEYDVSAPDLIYPEPGIIVKKVKKPNNKKNEVKSVTEKSNNETETKSVTEKSNNETETKSVTEKNNNETETKSVTEKSNNETETKSVTEKSDGETEIKSIAEKSDNETETKSVTEKSDDETEIKSVTEKSDDETEIKSVTEKSDNETETKSVTEKSDGETETKSVTEKSDDETETKSVTEKSDNENETKSVTEKNDDETETKSEAEKNDNETETKSEADENENETETKSEN